MQENPVNTVNIAFKRKELDDLIEHNRDRLFLLESQVKTAKKVRHNAYVLYGRCSFVYKRMSKSYNKVLAEHIALRNLQRVLKGSRQKYNPTNPKIEHENLSEDSYQDVPVIGTSRERT